MKKIGCRSKKTYVPVAGRRHIRIYALVLILSFAAILADTLSGCAKDGDDPQDTFINPFAPLVCGDPSPEALALYNKLAEVYGKKTLSGQYVNVFENPAYYENDVFQIQELQAVHSVTGRYPAVLGLDATRFEDKQAQHVLKLAEDYWKAGGIVTMCWHWFAPEGETGRGSFYTKDTVFILADALADKTSTGYRRLVEDINNAATMLSVLKDAGVPVLWRPLHEASGKWFWWGASGKEAYKELYALIFDIFNNQYRLSNLIWVWNGQQKDWYVGNNFCDMLGEDIYSAFLYMIDPALSESFKTVSSYASKKKMVALSENSYLPDIDGMFEAEKVWLFWATWCYEFVCVKGENGRFTAEYSEEYVNRAELAAAYADPRVVTLEDKLPGR